MSNKPEPNLPVIEDSIWNIWLLNKFKLYKYEDYNERYSRKLHLKNTAYLVKYAAEYKLL